MKNNLKAIIASSVAALAFGAVSVGTTFALFTDRDEASVQVNSGKINVSANLNDVKVYSAVFEDEDVYHEELQTVTEEVAGITYHLFSNGGYAAYDDNQSLLVIDRITPGDLVTFSFDVGGESTVSFKYRFSYIAVDTDDNPSTPYLDLIKGMDATIKVGEEEGTTYRGLAKYQTAWELRTPEDEFDDVEFTLSLPVTAGNNYQNKDAKILVAFEAVQANAQTDGDAEIILVEEDIVSEPSVAINDEPTVVNATSSTSNLAFEVTVPANAQYSGGAVTEDDKLTIEVTDLGKTEEVYSTETSLNFDLVLKVNNEPVNDFSEPLDVKIYVGTGLIIASVNHNSTEVTDYVYNAETGYITFQTNSFSPFEVSFISGVEVRNQDELFAALANGGKIGVKADIVLNQYIPVNKDTTIIGFGHTLTVNATRALRIGSNNIEVNLGDLNLVGGSNCERGLQVDSNKVDVKINLDKVSISGVSHYAINLCASCQVDIEINNSTITGYAAINAYGAGHHINAYKSSFNGVNPYSGTSNSFCTICLEGDDYIYSSDYVMKFVECTISASSTGDQYEALLGFNPNARNSSVEFRDCTFVQGERCPFGYDQGLIDSNLIIINGQIIEHPHNYFFDLNLED